MKGWKVGGYNRSDATDSVQRVHAVQCRSMRVHAKERVCELQFLDAAHFFCILILLMLKLCTVIRGRHMPTSSREKMDEEDRARR